MMQFFGKCNCAPEAVAKAAIAGSPPPHCEEHPAEPDPEPMTDTGLRNHLARAIRQHAEQRHVQRVRQARSVPLNSPELTDMFGGETLPSVHDHKPFDA